MSDFLARVDFNKICSPSYNSAIQILESQPEKVLLITGKDLIRRNVENEVHRLQYNNSIIDSATNEIWNSRLSTSQKNSFERLAYNIKITRNADTIDRISRIDTPQANSSVEDEFFNGAKFYGNESHSDSYLSYLLRPSCFP